MTKCRRDECQDEAATRGLCHRHYQQASRLGCLDAWALPIVRVGPPCSIPGCQRVGRGKRCLCKTHDAVLRVQRPVTVAEADWYVEEKTPEPTAEELAEYERRKAEVRAERMAGARS